MNFREFTGAVEVHLRKCGWLFHGNNGVWRKYKKAGETNSIPLPAALVAELFVNGEFMPQVELYLQDNGWLRTSSGVSTGWPRFRKGGDSKTMDKALLEQLKLDRLNPDVYSPRTTPSELRSLLIDVDTLRKDSPPPSGYANTAPARR